MPNTYSKKDIKRMFQQAKRLPDDTKKKELIRELFDIISDEKYREGEIAHILRGGIIDEGFTKKPTGILKIPLLHILYLKYSEISWEVFRAESSLAPRFLYISYVLGMAHQMKGALSISSDQCLSLLHLNSFLRIPLYSSAPIRGTFATVNHNYGFPAIYTSEVLKNGGKLYEISECTLDIIKDRNRKNMIYNRGYLFNLPNYNKIFYFDRRSNISMQNAFIRHCIDQKKDYEKYSPRQKFIDKHKSLLDKALDILGSDLKAKIKLRKYLRLSNDIGYSMLGLCLFEILHEFLSDRHAEINNVNKIFQELDPKQKKRWSTRGFSINTVEVLEKVLNRRTKKGKNEDEPFEDFAFMFSNLALNRLKAFPATDAELDSALNECAFNSEFYKQFYECENNGYSVDKANKELYKLGDELGQEMGSHILRIIEANDVGCVCIPFQPDSRGEILVTPNISFLPSLEVHRVRVDLSKKPFEVKIEEKNIKTEVIIDSKNKEPSPFHFFDHMFVKELDHSIKYNTIYNEILPSSESRAKMLCQRIGSKNIFAVIVPFYKEKESFVNVALESARAILNLGFTPLIILSSNQPTHEPKGGASHLFPKSVGMVEQELGKANIGKLWSDYYIMSLQTDKINGFNYWMIEKFINIHIGLSLIKFLHDGGVTITSVAIIEGDVERSKDWWLQIDETDVTSNDIIIFDHDVGVRDEGTTKAPFRDLHGSDALLSNFIAEPLTKLVTGFPIKNLLGGNFILKINASLNLYDLLNKSNHNESLLESWLLDLLSDNYSMCIKNVGQKIHLPALNEHLFSTDEKFIKWNMDLFNALYRYLNIKSNAKISVQTKLNKKVKTNYYIAEHVDEKDVVYNRIIDAYKNYSYCKEIYRKILPKEIIENWNKKIHSLYSWADRKTSRKPPKIPKILWMKTLKKFFKYIKGKRLNTQEEAFFALKVLFTFKVSSYGF